MEYFLRLEGRREVLQRFVAVEDEDARGKDRARALHGRHALSERHLLALRAPGRDGPEGGRAVLAPDVLRGFVGRESVRFSLVAQLEESLIRDGGAEVSLGEIEARHSIHRAVLEQHRSSRQVAVRRRGERHPVGFPHLLSADLPAPDVQGQTLVTAGGRVLGVVGLGDSLRQAVDTAYRGMEAIQFEGMRYRTDIAHRAFAATTGS